MSEHAKGRLRVIKWTEHAASTLVPVANAGGGSLGRDVIAQCHSQDVAQREANARRLVACWNFLLHFTTEEIESGAADLTTVLRDRSELIEALRSTLPLLENCSGTRVWNIEADGIAENIRALLARLAPKGEMIKERAK